MMIKLPLKKPKTIEAAVEAMLELESYLVQHNSPGTVAPVRVDSVDQRSSKSMEMMAQLLTRVEQLEMRGQREQNSGGIPQRQPERYSADTVFRDREAVVCYRCG